jgi:hypothetical protein
MSTALTLFDQPSLAIPSHISTFFDEESNVAERASFNALNVTGKVWSVTVNGENTKLTKQDADGDEVPISIMRVVVLDYGKRRGRSYFEGNYDPNATSKPKCWSDDGLAPSAQVAEPIASKCDGCPMSVKGSKVSDSGKAGTACSQHRILAVVPANKLDFPALRFKLAVTSDYDGQSPDLQASGWYAFSNLLDLMRSKGVQHTATMVVKMKFDPNAAYPKVIFSPDRWLNEAELVEIRGRVKSDEVQQLITGTTPGEAAPALPAPKAAPAAAPKATASVVIEDEDEDEAPAPKAAKAAPKAAPKPPIVDDDDEAPAPKATKAAPKKAAKPIVDDEDEAPKAKAVKAEVPEDVESLLADWGDD